jgi:hypothetical protein
MGTSMPGFILGQFPLRVPPAENGGALHVEEGGLNREQIQMDVSRYNAD